MDQIQEVMMKKFGMWMFLFLVGLYSMGCMEVSDDVSDVCRCRQALIGEEDCESMQWLNSENTSDECALFMGALSGTWYTVQSAEKMQFRFYDDGQYDLWGQQGDRWSHREHGTYRIEYSIHRGVYRSLLYLKKSEMPEYPVYFNVMDGRLYIEEYLGDENRLELCRGAGPEA